MKPFQSIPEAARTTGLGQRYLREGCENGTIPFVMSGVKHFINVPKLLKQLDVPSDFDRTDPADPSSDMTDEI